EDQDAVEAPGATWALAPALHLDEVAVLILPQRGELVLERPQPRHERRPPWDLHPHGQRIDEQPEHPLHALELGRASGHRHPEHHFTLAAVGPEDPGPR